MSGPIGFNPIKPPPAPIQRGLKLPGNDWTKQSVQGGLDVLNVAGKDLPSLHQFLGLMAGPPPDALQTRITLLLTKYHEQTGTFERYYILQDMFAAVDAWLAQKHPATLKQRETAMLGVYKIIVGKLCEFFQVAPNRLPEFLRERYFKAMVHAEPGEDAGYMQDVAREKTRLSFVGGSWERFSVARNTNVKVNTNEAEMMAAIGQIDQPELIAESGYVFSIWNALYATKHQAGHFHSQYMAGRAVHCAGELTMRNGVLERLSNSSGHYRPSPDRLLLLVWHLMSLKVPLANVDVVAIEACPDHAERLYARKAKAPQFLAGNGPQTEHWMRRLDTNDFSLLRPVTGRLRFTDNRLVAGFIVKLETPSDPTLECQARIKPDGSFVMQSPVGLKGRERWVDGAVPYADYRVRVYTPEAGDRLRRVGAVAAPVTVADAPGGAPRDWVAAPAP